MINGTVNNGAASPFAQLAGFGNNRRGFRPLYNGGFGIASFDTSALDAHPASLNGTNTARPSFNNGQFVFNFGGPMKIPGITKNNNGPNFFVGYQRVQTRTVSVLPGRMPTEAERNGDLSQTSGVLISPDRISPQARALLGYFPLPNSTADPRYNYQIANVNALHQDSVQTNINKGINQKNRVFGNFAMQGTRSDRPNIFNFLDSGRGKGITGAINWTHNPTQRFSMQFRYQYSRQTNSTTPFFANRLNVAGLAGITGNNQDPVNWGPPALVFASGFSSLSDGQYSSVKNQTSTVSYNSFWGHGRHDIQFGGDVRRQQFNTVAQQDPRGQFQFTGAVSGSDFGDFLLGIPSASSIAFGNADKYFRQTVYDGFLSDNWRVNGALTLNLGARWEYEAPISEKYNRLVNLNITPGFSQISPVVGNGLVHGDAVDLLPRLAFAWRPIAASSVIVRGTYGRYRNTNVYKSITDQMAQQAPLSKSLNAQNSPANPLTLANGFTAGPGVTQTTFAIDPNFRIGYADIWTLSVQRDLPFALQMLATYTGTKGTRLPQEFLPNTTPTGPIGPAGFIFLGSNGNSNREAGQFQLRRRLRSGFTATTTYTYAKAIDDAPLMAGNQVITVTQGGASVAQDWLNLRGERARSSFDQRHQLSVQGQYTSGSGVRGGALLSGWKGAILKEWLIASNLTVGSGLPQTPVYFALVPGTGVSG
ncbi:MAG TPA: TonB-dependent receptor, partial [Terriglobia bacterium]|nr:TonB-dependent receptor [Terriglobia bacterium]